MKDSTKKHLAAQRVFEGPAGRVVQLDEVAPEVDWRARCTLAGYLAHCPKQSPAWDHYLLFGIHLREVPGQDPPPKLRTPEATHEITVVALDPKLPTPDHRMWVDRQAHRFLTPINVSIQIEDTTDEQCRELLKLLAWGMAQGHVPAEPPLSGNPTREPTWLRTIEQTLTHIKLGGHPQAEA